jgi:hypothetical protein
MFPLLKAKVLGRNSDSLAGGLIGTALVYDRAYTTGIRIAVHGAEKDASMKRTFVRVHIMVLVAFMFCDTGFGQPAQNAAPQPSSDSVELAQQLTNPVSSLISVPFQNNFDFRIGENDGFRYLLNFQPVVPFRLTGDWNLISRTIVPFVHQRDVIGISSQTGLSDAVQSFFFSPAATEPFIWGAGACGAFTDGD